MRTILIIFVALVVVAGGGGYYWLLQQQEAARLAQSTPVAEVVELKEVYVPVENIFAGTIIKPEHLRGLPMEDAALSAEMVPAGPKGEALLIGSVARRNLAAGAPIVRSAVVQPGDRGFLAAVLPQGKRAISIPITEVAGISGLALPGDRVDIILTYSVTSGPDDEMRDVKASETVMTNIRVLALDQRLHQAATETDAPPIASTATLQVSPREAEMVTLATTLGELSMVLNSVHDGGDAEAAKSENATLEFARMSGGMIRPRHLTLDSDVTSLLLRQNEPALEIVADRNQRIQIVRGRTSGGVELDGAAQAMPPEPTGTIPSDPAGNAPLGAAYAGEPLEIEAPIE